MAAPSSDTRNPRGTTCGAPFRSEVASRARRWLRRYSSSFSVKAAMPSRSLLQQALGEHDVNDLLHRLQARPVALQLARERDPSDRLSASLDDALHPTSVRFD